MKVFDGQGHPLELGKALGAGGEGTVYAVSGSSALVAKIYHKPSPERGTKVSLMARNQAPEVKSLTTWPTEILSDKPNGSVIGFLMPSAAGYREAHFVYGVKDRKVHFTKADWRFLVRAAGNLARAFAVVHGHGHVIGDVNHSSVMVSPDATVKLIDCDSWQISLEGQRFPNLVGEPLHTAPELQGKSLAGVVRTPNHDLFGMAVLVFELLFMGRHPFSGRYTGPGDPGLEDHIRSFRFAYGAGAAGRQMAPPPGSLPLEAAGPKLAALFEAAFSAEGVRLRPPASAWITALDTLFDALTKCAKNDAHVFWKGGPGCPWCGIEALTGVAFFNPTFQAVPNPGGSFDLALVWSSIEAVRPPTCPPLPHAPSNVEAQPEVLKAAQRRRWTILGGLALVTLIAIGLGLANLAGLVPWVVVGGVLATLRLAPLSIRKELERRRAVHATAQARLSAIRSRWEAEATDRRFRQRLNELGELRAKHQSLPALRQAKMQELQRTIRERQLERYLDGFLIISAGISGIGLGRSATLRSYNIESAADVDAGAILQIPGFGPSLTDKLLDWRRDLESRFRFDPSQGIDPADVARVEAEIVASRTGTERELRNGAHSLLQIVRQTESAQATLRSVVTAAADQFALAEANMKALAGF